MLICKYNLDLAIENHWKDRWIMSLPAAVIPKFAGSRKCEKASEVIVHPVNQSRWRGDDFAICSIAAGKQWELWRRKYWVTVWWHLIPEEITDPYTVDLTCRPCCRLLPDAEGLQPLWLTSWVDVQFSPFRLQWTLSNIKAATMQAKWNTSIHRRC